VELAAFEALAFAVEPEVALTVEPEVALTIEFVDAAAPVLTAALGAAAVAEVATAAAAVALVFVVVLVAVVASLAAPLDCETAWVRACSNAVNKLLPLLLPPAAPVDPE